MATALPMPLLAPVIKKDRPATDTSTSFSIKCFDADSNAALEQTHKKCFLKTIKADCKGCCTKLTQMRIFSIVKAVAK